jgi:hypothetical protein
MLNQTKKKKKRMKIVELQIMDFVSHS